MQCQEDKVVDINALQAERANWQVLPEPQELVPLQVVEPRSAVIAAQLTEKEKVQLGQCEAVLRKQFGAVFEVGSALIAIRDGRLYRATHATFEAYCRERLCISRSYAWRVLGATERFKLLPADSNGPKPTNESQIRPFLAIDPADFPKAWEAAVKAADRGQVTQSIAHKVIRAISGGGRVPARRRSRRFGSPQSIPLGQVLSLLLQARRRVEHYEAEEALAALDAIEQLLFGPNGPSKNADVRRQSRAKAD